MADRTAEEVALKFAECINKGDVECLVALMTSGFTMITDEGEPESGRVTMEAGFRGYLADYPEYQIHVHKVARSGNSVAIVGQTTGSHIAKEIEETETVIWVAEVTEGGRVAEWRIYSDRSR